MPDHPQETPDPTYGLVRRLRIQQRLSQAQLAGLAGVSKRTIERLESGRGGMVSLRSLVNVAVVLDCESLLEVIEEEWMTWEQRDAAAPVPKRTKLERSVGRPPAPVDYQRVPRKGRID